MSFDLIQNNFAAILSGVNLPNVETAGALDKAITLILQLAAALSLIYIIIGAVRFSTSAGDPQKIAQARQTLIYAIVGLVVSVAAFTIAAVVQSKAALVAGGGSNAAPLFGPDGIVTVVVDMLGYVVGVASVIMMIVGALRFITSAGQPQSAAAARNTVIYALIGLAVAVAAKSIVTFVLGRF